MLEKKVYFVKRTSPLHTDMINDGDLLYVTDLIKPNSVIVTKVNADKTRVDSTYYCIDPDDFTLIDWFSLTDKQKFLCKLGNYSCVE